VLKLIGPLLQGVWIGMLFGTFVQTLMLITITFKTDWDKQVINQFNIVSIIVKLISVSYTFKQLKLHMDYTG